MTSGHSRRCSACTGPFRLAPQELLDHIISYLADDKATLLSCALVHPTWTSISRYHLPPLNLVISCPSRVTDLTELIHPPHETLSSSISGITLVGDLPFLNDLCITSGKFPRARFYGKLLRFLRAKPTVTLREGTVENDPALVRTLADTFPDLTSLNVRCASHQDIAGFMRALSGGSELFPRLAELGMELGAYGMDRPHTSLALRDVRLGLPGLRRLRVVGWNDELVRWLGDNIVGTLERLDLDSVNVWSTCRVEEADSLIRGNKETLRDVRLSFSERDVIFNLSGLVCLENLEVTSAMDDLEGWRLPMSLKRVYLRIVVRYFRCDIIRVETEGELLLEGEELERQLMIWQ